MSLDIVVKGMYCNSCSARVESVLTDLPFIENATVNLDKGNVHLKTSQPISQTCTDGRLEEIQSSILSAGFHVSMHNHQLHCRSPAPGARFSALVSNLSNSSNMALLEKIFDSLDGVFEFLGSISTSCILIRFDPNVLNVSDLKRHISNAGVELSQAHLVAAPNQELYSITLIGMTCGTCSSTIERTLAALSYVVSASVNLATECATLMIDLRSGNTIQDVCEAIEDIGYEAQLRLDVASNALENSKALRAQQHRTLMRWRRRLIICVVFALPVFILAMILPRIPGALEKSGLLQSIGSGIRISRMAFIMWILCTPLQFGVGWFFYRDSFFAIKNNAPDMNVLVAIGTSAAYVYSVLSLLIGIFSSNALNDHSTEMGGEHFFETSTTLITFVVLGKFLEHIARGQTSEAIFALRDLQPSEALLVQLANPGRGHNNVVNEQVIDSRMIKQGDFLKVVPGAAFPCDGHIVSGMTTIDESMMTGESLPVRRGKGHAVIGSTVNQDGLVIIRASDVGVDSTLCKIVKLVEDAQTTKPHIQNMADRISRRFVPFVLCVSMTSFITWLLLASSNQLPSVWLDGSSPLLFALLFGIAVLVIACPCALGLAVPTAIMVATGVGAKLGCLVKSGQALENASSVNAIVLDKTGTLTFGAPEVSDFVLTKKTLQTDIHLTRDQVLFLSGSAELGSEHVISRAVIEYVMAAKTSKQLVSPSPDTFEAKAGFGVYALIEQHHVLIGNKRWIDEHNVIASVSVVNDAATLQADGKTVLFVCIDNEVEALMALSDKLRPEAKAVCSSLIRSGIELWVATGDNQCAAKFVARQCGIENVVAEALPSTKHQIVLKLQQQNKKVAVVGDGVNDSPALAQADVGIAIGAGADIAMEAADIVLVRSHLGSVLTAIELGRTTIRRIKINLFWALIFNAIGIPIAAGLFFPLIKVRLPPELAAFAMALSSVTVVTSSLLLRHFRAPLLSVTPSKVSSLSDDEENRYVSVNIGATLSNRCPSCTCKICRCTHPCRCGQSERIEKVAMVDINTIRM